MDGLINLAFEAVCTPCNNNEFSVFHATCFEGDIYSCKTILSYSPSKLDTALALRCKVKHSSKYSLYCGSTARDLVKSDETTSRLFQIIDKAEKNTQGLSLIHEAARSGSIRQIKRVLNLGEHIDKPSPLRDDGHATPLLLAAASNSCQAVRFLIENGADITAKDRGRNGILHYAAIGGVKETVSYLLGLGIPVDCKSTWGKTPLHVAAVKGHAEILLILIQNGADLDSCTGFDDIALLLAAEEGHFDCVKMLVQSGSRVNAANMALFTALHNAAKEGHLEVVKYLLQSGSRVDAFSAKGETPLSLAVRKEGSKDMVALLLRYGSSFNLCDRYGRTPLHYSVSKGVAELLVQEGADIHARDFEGKDSTLFSSVRWL